jgi:transposase
MSEFSPGLKHRILSQYQPHCRGAGFGALAARYGVAGGERTVRRWFAAWDGTPRSLQRKSGSGRPRALSGAQATRYIYKPIQRKNRAHRAVHYTQLLPTVRAGTGKAISLRTVQRYGKNLYSAKNKRTEKRTAQECEHTDIQMDARVLLGLE